MYVPQLTVGVKSVDHALDDVIIGLETQRRHRQLQLLGRDCAVAVTIEERERYTQL